MIPLSEAIVAEQLELVRTAFGRYADVKERGVLYKLVEVQRRLGVAVGVFLPVRRKLGRLLDEGNDLLPQGGCYVLGTRQRMEVRCQTEHVVRGLASAYGGVEVTAAVAAADDDGRAYGIAQRVEETLAQPLKSAHGISRRFVVEAADVCGHASRELLQGKPLHAMRIKAVRHTAAMRQYNSVRPTCRGWPLGWQ